MDEPHIGKNEILVYAKLTTPEDYRPNALHIGIWSLKLHTND